MANKLLYILVGVYYTHLLSDVLLVCEIRNNSKQLVCEIRNDSNFLSVLNFTPKVQYCTPSSATRQECTVIRLFANHHNLVPLPILGYFLTVKLVCSIDLSLVDG